jgi:hypothetical protein
MAILYKVDMCMTLLEDDNNNSFIWRFHIEIHILAQPLLKVVFKTAVHQYLIRVLESMKK